MTILGQGNLESLEQRERARRFRDVEKKLVGNGRERTRLDFGSGQLGPDKIRRGGPGQSKDLALGMRSSQFAMDVIHGTPVDLTNGSVRRWSDQMPGSRSDLSSERFNLAALQLQAEKKPVSI